MLNTDSIRNKEVINICDGKSMGFVCDIEINLKEGRIEGIVIPGQRGFLNLWGKESEDYVIKWKDVRTVGEDVILVEVPVTMDTNC
jgi:YlmC/YmxH family sporulation protein